MTSNDPLTWRALTSAALLQAQKKSGRRLGQKKSRQGCITCKIRRIKCDETHPACMRCTSTGRMCEGYVSHDDSKTRALLPTRPSHGLQLDVKDARSFDYFLTWVAPRLAGSLDKDFWCGQVLQLAHAERPVLDALLSLSILYEHPQFMHSFQSRSASTNGFESAASSTDGASWFSGDDESSEHDKTEVDATSDFQNLDRHHAAALRIYNRSISGFRESMAAGQTNPMLALLTCVLFICIELIRDDVYAALSLFTQGKQLLKSISDDLRTTNEKLYTTIKSMFARLGVLAVVWGDSEVLEVPIEYDTSGDRRIFASLSDARSSLFALMASSRSFMREAAAYKQSIGFAVSNSSAEFDTAYVHDDFTIGSTQAVRLEMCSQVSTPVSEVAVVHLDHTANIPDSLLAQHMELELRLGQWYDAFQGIKETDQETSSCLMMHYHVSLVWQTTRLSPFQTVFDNYTDHFQEILRLAEIYVNAKAAENTVWTSEIGVTPALYFAATKCRVPSLRRKALDLLMRAPAKECMWGARSCAEIATRLIRIEEEGVGLDRGQNATQTKLDDSILPSEDSRIHTVEICRSSTLDRHYLRVFRYPIDDCGNRIRVVQICPL